MKNKKGKSDTKVWAVLFLILVLIGGIYYYTSLTKVKTLLEHAVPADISKSEQGTGLLVKFYDANGEEIQIPEWFSASSGSIKNPLLEQFAVVSRPSTPVCAVRTDCKGATTIPQITCLDGKCSLGNVVSMSMGIRVFNPSSSVMSFTSVTPTIASPVAFNNTLPRTVVAKLATGENAVWNTPAPIVIGTSGWLGTTQTFSATVTGISDYNGATNTVSDSLQLSFAADPTGSLVVQIVSPI